MDKQRQIGEFPQGGIVDSKNLLSLGYCCGTKDYMSNKQFQKFQNLNSGLNTALSPNISTDIKIDFSIHPDNVEEIVQRIIDSIKKV